MRYWPLLLVCALCLDWTRLSGTVKGVNLKDSTLTIQDKEGDLLIVPIDYQVKIIEKSGGRKELKTISLDDKVTLTRTPMEKPKEDSEGLAPPESAPR